MGLHDGLHADELTCAWCVGKPLENWKVSMDRGTFVCEKLTSLIDAVMICGLHSGLNGWYKPTVRFSLFLCDQCTKGIGRGVEHLLVDTFLLVQTVAICPACSITYYVGSNVAVEALQNTLAFFGECTQNPGNPPLEDPLPISGQLAGYRLE